MFRALANDDFLRSEPGYMVVPNLVLKNGIFTLIKEIRSISNLAKPGWLEQNSAQTIDGEYLVIRSIDTPSNLIFDCARHPTFVSLAEFFARKRVTPLYAEYFNKPPRSNLPSPLHQDHAFYNEHFPDELGVTFWIALEDCNPSNGCMHVRPQSERILHPHRKSQVPGFAYELENQDLKDLVAVPLKAGDVLLHGSFTPHYCPPNKSRRSRMALAISFRTSEYREQMSPWTP